MKKLLMLQLFVAASLVSSLTIQARQEMNMESTADFIEAEDAVQMDQGLGDELITELEKSTDGQQILEKMVRDESALESTFASVRAFIKTKIAELNKLEKQSDVAEGDVARIAEELTDAQTKLDEAEVRYIAGNKKKSKTEALVRAQLNKALHLLKDLQTRVLETLNSVATSQPMQSMKKNVHRAATRVRKSNASKAIMNASAQAGQAISDAAQQATDYVQNQIFADDAEETMPAMMTDESMNGENNDVAIQKLYPID